MEKIKVLIVEDECVVAEDIMRVLEKLGYSISEIVSSGEEAIERVKVDKPDIVLMDIVLQREMSGIEAAKEIYSRFGIPVVYLTAYADSDTINRAKSTDPFGYIVKPYTNSELYSNIEIALYKNQVQTRIRHLNNVLRAVRNINQMIVKEKSAEKLIQGACDNLTLTGSFPQAWIGIIDETGRLEHTAESGFQKAFDKVKKTFERDKKTDLYQQALSQSGIVIVQDTTLLFSEASLKKSYADQGAMISRLEYGDRIFGFLFVTVPLNQVNDKEERSIFKTVVGDIAFALYGIEMDEKRGEAEDALRNSIQEWESTFNAMSDWVTLVDLEGRIHRSNTALEQFSPAMKRSDVKNKICCTVLPDSDELLPKCPLKKMRNSQEKEVSEIKIPRRNQWVRVSAEPVSDTDGNLVGAVHVVQDITSQKKGEEKLQKSGKRLSEQNILLREKNIALREVMEQIHEEKKRVEKRIQANVDRILFPVIDKIKIKSKHFDKSYLGILKDNLANLTSSFGIHLSNKMYALTPKEIEICNMIKSGLTSKEISSLLNVSHRTVDTHRYRIRKKLGITKKSINLASYLSSL